MKADFSPLFSTFVTRLSDALGLSSLCVHQFFQPELTIETETNVPTSQRLKGNKFLLLEALLSFPLFLRGSYGCVALFTTLFFPPPTLDSEDVEPVIQQRHHKADSARKNQDNMSGK